MISVEKTLLEQLQLSDFEIDQRKELLDLTSNDIEAILQSKPLLEPRVDEILVAFYENQTKIQEIALLIGDADTLRRLHGFMRKYILDLFSGNYNTEYVNNRLRIGMVHKRIGVEPKYYLSATRVLKVLLSDILSEHITDKSVLSTTLSALEKLLYFDNTLVFDTYIDSLLDEIIIAKKKTEQYAKSLEKKVKERTRQLEELSRIDPLTCLCNQRAMYDHLKREISNAKRNNTIVSVIYFDVDNFKQINDTNGHMKGDCVLKDIGKILSENIREADIACRHGGDEFIIILPQCGVENAKEVCHKIIEKFQQLYPLYTLSMGIAQASPNQYTQNDELIKRADQKMYLAKKTKGFKIES